MAHRPRPETAPRIRRRPYEGDDDWHRVRDLLAETYAITPPGFNWEIRRWEVSRFLNPTPQPDPRWEATIHLWETSAGRLVGAAHPEGHGPVFFREFPRGRNPAYLQLHPDFRYVEEDMIAWAEKHLAVPSEDGQVRDIEFLVFDYDVRRARFLAKRGYQQTSSWEVTRRKRLGERPPPVLGLPEGYTLRSMRAEDGEECVRMAMLVNAAFGRPIHAPEDFRTLASFAPSFELDLQLIAEAPDGSFAAHVGIFHDEAHRRGVLRPVCTHPDHRRRGLARTLVYAGLHRLRERGATLAHADAGPTVPGNRLLDAVGFDSEVHRAHAWRRVV